MFRLDAKRALVATVDFFAPVVDDPRDYGAIAAANAISDVYAMGGKPLYALNLVGFPRGQPWELLTKALGTGIVVSAIKKEQASPEVLRAAVLQMKTLNRAAGETLARAWKDVHALTDVTGFGLLGHLDSMLRASSARALVRADAVRVLPGVRVLAQGGLVPGGTRSNLEFVEGRTQFPDAMGEADRLVLADAQTNGGMLAAVAPRAAGRLLRKLADAGAPAVQIGEVVPRGKLEPGVTLEGALQG